MIIQGYGIVAAFVILSIAFVTALLLVSYILQPKAPNIIKKSTYECGMQPEGDARIQFNVKYYLYAIIFVIFDVEAIFLFPWALIFNTERTLTLAIEAFVFVIILVIGLIYAWKKDVLKWQ